MAFPEKEVKNTSHNALPIEVVDCIHEHIQSLPVRSSHYTCECNPNRQYIDLPDKKKTIKWIYNIYHEWMIRQKNRYTNCKI